MTTVHARRPGMPPRSAALVVGRAVLRVLAVVVLIAGIVAMHSLGLGHGPMPAGHSGNGVMAGPAQMVGMGAAPAGHAATAAVEVMTVEVKAVEVKAVEVMAVEVMAAVDDPGHGMAAMCLAVLPLLVLLLARLMGWRVRSLTHAVRRLGTRGSVPGYRAPPALLRPSLLKLCILRT